MTCRPAQMPVGTMHLPFIPSLVLPLVTPTHQVQHALCSTGAQHKRSPACQAETEPEARGARATGALLHPALPSASCQPAASHSPGLCGRVSLPELSCAHPHPKPCTQKPPAAFQLGQGQGQGQGPLTAQAMLLSPSRQWTAR